MINEITEREINPSFNSSVVFYTPECAICSLMKPVFEKAGEKTGKEIYKLNANNNSALCERLGIMSVPTLVRFEGGKARVKRSGRMSLSDAVNIIG